jgi:hypothetical protein
LFGRAPREHLRACSRIAAVTGGSPRHAAGIGEHVARRIGDTGPPVTAHRVEPRLALDHDRELVGRAAGRPAAGPGRIDAGASRGGGGADVHLDLELHEARSIRRRIDL